jgi:hypothetical protein
LSEQQHVELPAGSEEDQASGLRRIFDRIPAHWTLVLQPPLRLGNTAEALAARARILALRRGPTLVIDASRTQVAAALGLRLRYDLEHALAGDCEIGEACAGAGGSLWILPAARALDLASSDERHARRVAEALQSVAIGMREVILILPSTRISWVRHCPALKGIGEAVIPVFGSAETGTAVLTTIRQAVGDLEIGTFHLLFLGMGEATAGRLLAAMAAIARRHFGATLLAAKPVADEPGAPADARSRDDAHRLVERVF